jgi:Acyl-CoA carboxylase epsilon subunit
MLLLMSETAGYDERAAPQPLIRVVRGTPTPEELAALVGVLVRHARPAAAQQPVAASLWAASGRPGFARRPGSWRAGGLPGIRVI